MNLKILVLLAALPFSAMAQYFVTDTLKVNSKILNQSRACPVLLPADFDASKSYPVMYVLDAESKFAMVKALVEFGQNSRTKKEIIVIGVPNTDRQKNLTFQYSSTRPDGSPSSDSPETYGGGQDFHEFLKTDLIPMAEGLYGKTESTAYGHSYAGMFLLHSLTLEPLFDNYVAIDPSVWFDDSYLIDLLSEKKGLLKDHPIFIGYEPGRESYDQQMTKLLNELSDLENIKNKRYPDRSHLTVFLSAFIDSFWETNAFH